MAWRLPTLRTYFPLPILSIMLEIMVSSFLDFGLLLMANIAWPTKALSFGPNSMYIYIRTSESLDIFKKRIELVNLTSLIYSTCEDWFFFNLTTNNWFYILHFIDY